MMLPFVSMVDTARGALVSEALSWVGTPYHKMARVKGAGCDCATFLAESLVGGEVVSRADMDAMLREVGLYSDDWFHHTNTQRYLKALMRFARLVIETRCHAAYKAEPGNLVLTKCVNSENWNHGGIVVKWPQIVHAVSCVSLADASRDPMWTCQEIAVFDPFVKL